MNLVYRWLQDYVKTTTPPEELGERFRMTSSEMEAISWGYSIPEKVVVGHVLELTKHPDADRLRVAKIKTGKETRTIVCGAPNIAIDQHVIVALPSAILHPLNGETLEIKKSTIRGVDSEGMCCSASELGIPTQTKGIIVLDQPVKPGTPASQALQLSDAILDLEITPNRPDLLSYYGLAREISAFEKHPLLDIPIASIEIDKSKEQPLEARVDNPKLCSRYSLISLEIPKVIESPWWLQARLIMAGIRPLNCVVDVTNYVMLELGQPLHAFDRTLLSKSSKRSGTFLTVREGHRSEKITLLDGSVRELSQDDIVIGDSNGQAIALGGVMGGQETAINSETTQVILESAMFNGPTIRRTSRRLGLRSEASLRFEKGLDPELTVTALKRALHLLQEIAGATITSSLTDIYNRQLIPARPRISISFNRIQQLLGIHIGAAECKTILQKLGFQLQSFTKSGFDATPPSWRSDIKLAEDVIEELIRIWGYERLPHTLPSGTVQAPEVNTHFELRRNLRHALAEQGGYELISQPFLPERIILQTGLSANDAIHLPNPLSKETECLTPNHLATFLLNLSTTNRDFVEGTIFEIGKVFLPPQKEEDRLSFLNRAGEMSDQQVRQVKMFLQRAIIKAGKEGQLKYQDTSTVAPYFDPKLSKAILINGQEIGTLGYIQPEIVAEFKIRSGRALLFVELKLEEIYKLPSTAHFYQPEAKYPKIERDVTLIVPETVSFEQIEKCLQLLKSPTIPPIWHVGEIYTSEAKLKGKVSITYHFTYSSNERTLEDREVQADIDRISADLRTNLSATIN